MEAVKRDIDRQSSLGPYLERLEDGPPPLHPSIALDRWEQVTLEEALKANSESKQYASLMIEGVAFQSKYFDELDQLETEEFNSVGALEKARNRLIDNAAIGLALMDEMQRVVDTMIRTGNMGEAKKLTGFRNKLSQIVHEIKDRIGSQGFLEAEGLSKEIVAPLEKTKLETKPVEVDEAPPKPIRLNRTKRLRPAQVVVEDKPNHSKKLLVVFVAAAAAWMILILPAAFKTPIPELTALDLPVFEPVQEVDARPPSMYIVVNGKSWNGISADHRLQWIEQTGETASASGYTGIHVRTEEGAAVAQWLQEKGARLVRASGPDS